MRQNSEGRPNPNCQEKFEIQCVPKTRLRFFDLNFLARGKSQRKCVGRLYFLNMPPDCPHIFPRLLNHAPNYSSLMGMIRKVCSGSSFRRRKIRFVNPLTHGRCLIPVPYLVKTVLCSLKVRKLGILT